MGALFFSLMMLVFSSPVFASAIYAAKVCRMENGKLIELEYMVENEKVLSIKSDFTRDQYLTRDLVSSDRYLKNDLKSWLGARPHLNERSLAEIILQLDSFIQIDDLTVYNFLWDSKTKIEFLVANYDNTPGFVVAALTAYDLNNKFLGYKHLGKMNLCP